MLFKVINNDKVKILIEKDDVENFRDVEKSISDGKVSRSVAELLVMVYEHTGVNFLNSKIILETVRGACESYYIIVTRIIDNGLNLYNKAFEDDEVNMYIFRLDGIEAFIDVLEIAKKRLVKNNFKYRLYRYRKKEYLCLYFKCGPDCGVELETLIKEVEPLAKRCRWDIINDSLLCEWGELICDGAVESGSTLYQK